MAKNAPKTAEADDGDMSIEDRVKRLEKLAMQHGWNLDDLPLPVDPVDPPL